MWYPRRRPDPVEQLLRARFSVYVTLRAGLHAMITVTRLVVTVRTFTGALDGDPAQTWHFDRRAVPESLHDGHGFNLDVLREFLRSLGESCAGAKEQVVQRTKQTLALYARMAHMTRRKQRAGSSCLMLPCKAIRQFVPALKAETVKFWLLAAANGDELGRAWGATDYFWGLGYHPEKSGKRLAELEALGLMRYLRKSERDHLTGRYKQDVYQFNPSLFYIRKALRPAALALSPVPFQGLPEWERQIGSPDRNLRGKSDHNQNLDPKPESRRKIQNQITNASNHHHHQNSAFEGGEPGQDVRRNGIDWETEQQDGLPNESSADKRKNQKPAHSATQTPAPQGAEIPPSPRSARPPSRRVEFEQALSDESAEQLAQDIKAKCETRLWQARELVAEYGAALVGKALEMVIDEKKKRVVRTEIGLMRHWLSKGMVEVEAQATVGSYYSERDGRRYISGKDADMIEW